MNKQTTNLYPDTVALRPDYAKLGQANRNAQTHDIYREGRIIFANLKGGNYFTVACRQAGVNVRTAQRWLALGKAGLGAVTKDGHVCREEHVWFYELCMTAIAEVEGRVIECWMQQIEKGDWRAARDFLAWRFPNRWGNRLPRADELGGQLLDEAESLLDEADPLREDAQDQPIEPEPSQPQPTVQTESSVADSAEITSPEPPDTPAVPDERVEFTPTPSAPSPLTRHVQPELDSRLDSGDEALRDNFTSLSFQANGKLPYPHR
ncbi:MAG TPA: hypothetical protein VKQ72_11340 [Aggregatilineales bacterium]|nr:hypothetical protein [Aggregatilineales bacterium]